MTIESINKWHALARPEPDHRAFNVQLGCHLEEIAEMFDMLVGDTEQADNALLRANNAVSVLAMNLKNGSLSVTAPPEHRSDFLDAICDQIVTGIGVAHCANMDAVEGLKRVDASSWTKVVDGEFLRDSNGKIVKPPGYEPPSLEGCY